MQDKAWCTYALGMRPGIVTVLVGALRPTVDDTIGATTLNLARYPMYPSASETPLNTKTVIQFNVKVDARAD